MSKYHMQKAEREIQEKAIQNEIIRNGKFTTIAMCRNNEPYIITLSYGFDQDKNTLYFHSAKEGLKFEFLNENSSVCGTVIEDHGYNENRCSHSYRSVVFWGKMILIKDLSEKIHGFDILLNHLEQSPAKLKRKFLKNPEVYYNTSILRLDIDEIKGKSSI